MTRTGTEMKPNSRRLRLLATSDVHSNLLSHDYYADLPHPGIGLSRTSSLISQARAEVDALGGLCLLLDNGDWLQGGPIADAKTRVPGAMPPAVQAFAHLNYDAVGLGNHEFNFGLEVLGEALKSLPCPAICSNLRCLDDTVDLPLSRQLILTRTLPGEGAARPPVKIGLFSVLPPQTLIWDADHLQGRVQFEDIVDTARRSIADLRAAGADVVVALAHTGLGPEQITPGMENALRPLTELPGLDAAIGGHTHLLLPPETGPAEKFDVPVVMPGSNGSHLGVIDLTLEWGADRWQVADAGCELRPISTRSADGLVPTVPEAPALVRILAPAHARTRAVLAQSVGYVDKPHHSYFTFIGEDRALALTAAAQAAAVRPTLNASDLANYPLLSAVAPAKFGGRAGPRNYTDVPGGLLSRRHVADICVFPNELRCVLLDGARLRDWLEMSAGFFNRLAPTKTGSPPMRLENKDRAGHNFDVIFGLEYEIDPTAAALFDAEGRRIGDGEGRIRNLRWQGAPVKRDQMFAVALNSYRTTGGGNFQMLDNLPRLPLPPQMVRDAVTAYIESDLAPDPLTAQPYPWRFCKHLGVDACALTGPGARPFLTELPAGLAHRVEVTEDGFLALYLSL
ncbi:2',3'-cyclic-nucleotide 2'-phosphodiesterase/3'-nucleotidase precursor [Tritonibacter horizontis]|uniref:2',3'-cyclic-nucleotide 2'-phosphodiesterase/3'-nucleotidase n=2 Tax=Tritonibacter horizontis TaxID=1768241 RepID=A0A132BS15_9RHOB|nr:2',3'-cyclic-nucleotide 2'-phosphodiesterase/3'-nucleotidase precursor [Tritonibacter horizontis]